jgi:hypothetical protein
VGLNLLTKADNQITQSGSAASLSPHPSRPHSTLFHVKSENDLYCAPEVHTKQLSTGADLYSIGALLFTLVTGHSPSSNLIFGKEWQQKEIIELGFEVSSSFFSLPSSLPPSPSGNHQIPAVSRPFTETFTSRSSVILQSFEIKPSRLPLTLTTTPPSLLRCAGPDNCDEWQPPLS